MNNEIITRSELDKAKQTAAEEVEEDCRGKCTPEEQKPHESKSARKPH